MIKALSLVALCALAGCVDVSFGPELTEPGRVEETHFVPGQSGTSTGISSSGHVVIGDISTDPVWATVFECQHGKFVIQGSDERARQLWAKLKPGDAVEIRYVERFESTDGYKTKKLTGIKFRGAEKVAKP
jgi:hypothetical protein